MILGYLAFIMIFAGIAAIIMWIQFGFWWGLVTYLIIGILGIVLLAFLVIKGKK